MAGSSTSVTTVGSSSLVLYKCPIILPGLNHLGVGPLVLTLSMSSQNCATQRLAFLGLSPSPVTPYPGSYVRWCPGLCHFQKPWNSFHLQVRETSSTRRQASVWEPFFWVWYLRANTFHPKDLKKLFQEVEHTKAIFSHPQTEKGEKMTIWHCATWSYCVLYPLPNWKLEIIIGF